MLPEFVIHTLVPSKAIPVGFAPKCDVDHDQYVEVNGHPVITILDVSERQRKHLVAGGTLNYVKSELEKA